MPSGIISTPRNIYATIPIKNWSTEVSNLSGISGSVVDENGAKKLTLVRAAGGAENGFVRLYQNITLEANSYYQLRFKAYGDLSRFALFGVREANSEIIRYVPEIFSTANTWKSYRFNFKTGVGTNWILEFRISNIASNSTTEIFVKDVQLEKVNSLSINEFAIGGIGDSQLVWLGNSAAELNDNSFSFISTANAYIMHKGLDYVIPVIQGEGGNNAGQIATRTSSMVNANPKPTYCIVETGTNDAAGGTNMTTFRNNVTSIINTLETGSIAPILMNVPPRTDEPANSAVEAYSNEIEDIATTLSLPLLDARTIFLNNVNWSSEFMIDQVHFNKIAHQAIGRALGELLLSLI